MLQVIDRVIYDKLKTLAVDLNDKVYFTPVYRLNKAIQKRHKSLVYPAVALNRVGVEILPSSYVGTLKPLIGYIDGVYYEVLVSKQRLNYVIEVVSSHRTVHNDLQLLFSMYFPRLVFSYPLGINESYEMFPENIEIQDTSELEQEDEKNIIYRLTIDFSVESLLLAKKVTSGSIVQEVQLTYHDLVTGEILDSDIIK